VQRFVQLLGSGDAVNYDKHFDKKCPFSIGNFCLHLSTLFEYCAQETKNGGNQNIAAV